MQASEPIRQAMYSFFDRLSAGDVSAFYELVEVGEATLVVGTAPGEFVTEEERLRFGFELEGLSLSPGRDHGSWSEGDLGWYVGEPVVTLPDGTKQAWRMTTVWHQADGAWRLVHMHASVAVPDESVNELQAEWGTSPDTVS
ncbi:MAG TPA: nuclear transport factor 2 family protein [Acidimicrobiia bacterium]|nr:nuclear transport factor 2 family protein [Acidimicrobiia bacterium]